MKVDISGVDMLIFWVTTGTFSSGLESSLIVSTGSIDSTGSDVLSDTTSLEFSSSVPDSVTTSDESQTYSSGLIGSTIDPSQTRKFLSKK